MIVLGKSIRDPSAGEWKAIGNITAFSGFAGLVAADKASLGFWTSGGVMLLGTMLGLGAATLLVRAYRRRRRFQSARVLG